MNSITHDLWLKARNGDREAYDRLFGLHADRALLAEDNEINQQIAVELLEGEGVAVTIANDGQEVVDKLSAGGPSGYDASLSADCSGSIGFGQTKTCTVTNDDYLNQTVGAGGTAQDGPPSPSDPIQTTLTSPAAGTAASTQSRPPSCGRSCPTWRNGTSAGVRSPPRMAKRSRTPTLPHQAVTAMSTTCTSCEPRIVKH